ncbi:MAG: N-6 DNA methylase [Vicinamibacterales bacterium]
MPQNVRRLPLLDDPSAALEEFEQLLASNSGEEPFEVAMQLLTAKLFDEHRAPSATTGVRFTGSGTPQEVFDRVSALYRDAIRAWPELAGASSLRIQPEQLVRSIRPLTGWRILDSDLVHLDAVLERLVAKDAKGELGQYFTPREVVRMCVSLLRPTAADRVVDPACGSGAFLYESIRQSRLRGSGTPRCLGVDLSSRSIRVAQLVAHAVAPPTLQVHKGNSLDGREYESDTPREWLGFLGGASKAKASLQKWGAFSNLHSSVVLTNPPFAGEIDDLGIIGAYESQRLRRSSAGSVGREHLFVERAINLLDPEGRMAIVLPQGILANSTAGYLRQWIFSKCRVLAVVGLHPYAFLPYTGVKTSVVFLQRHGSRSPNSPYKIAFATSLDPGKDRSGRRRGAGDYDSIALALRRSLACEGFSWAQGSSGDEGGDAYAVEIVNSEEVQGHDRLDSEYYGREVRNLFVSLSRRSEGSVRGRVSRSVERARLSTMDEIDYIDISSVDGKSGLAVPVRMAASEAPSRATYLLRKGDVLVSTVRPDRNVVSLVTKESTVPLVASSGFCVLRPEGIPPELLFAYCKTSAFRTLLARRATASMYPTATDNDVLDLPFVSPSSSTTATVVEKVQSALQMLETAGLQIQSAIADVEIEVSTQKSNPMVLREAPPRIRVRGGRKNSAKPRSRSRT